MRAFAHNCHDRLVVAGVEPNGGFRPCGWQIAVHTGAVALSIPEAAIQWVAELFDPRVFARGLDYARDGRVHLVRGEWPVVARVRGTRGYVVTVHYKPENHHAHSECSCPVGFDCKHAAAAALVAMASQRDVADARYRARKEEAVGTWLARMGVAAAVDVPVRSRDVVAYVLAPGTEAPTLEVHRTRLRRAGTYGRSSPIGSPTDSQRGAPSWVSVDDLRRIALLRAVTRAGDHQTSLPIERIDAALWLELAETGRLFWDRVGGAILAAGSPRTLDLTWRELPDRPGELTIAVSDDVILLAAHECHYVDLRSAEIGRLDLGVPAAVVQQLIAAPPVPAAMLATVRRSLRPLLGESAATELAPHDDGDVADEVFYEPMRPQLTVALAAARGDEHELSLRADACYGDRVFELAVWEAERPAARDLVAEGARRDRLDRLLGELDDRAHDTGALGVLARLRDVAHRVVPTLVHEGWRCVLDDDLPVEPVITEATWVEKLRPRSESKWFSFELGVVVAGRTVPLLPILVAAIRDGDVPLDPALLAADRVPGVNLRLPDGALVHVAGDRLRRWLRPLLELELRGLDDAGELVVPGFTAVELADTSPGRFADRELLDEARARLERLLELQPRREPAGFGGELRDYQRRGLDWLHVLHDAGYGGLLADDMGLGKTVQALAFLDHLRGEGRLGAGAPALVVAPRSVVGHWRDEAVRFCPALEPAVHLGAGRPRSAEAVAAAPLVVTSYQTMLRDVDMLGQVDWSVVLFDEAQALKNPSTRVRKAAARLRAQSRFAITGTPIENHLRELWSQMDLVMPGLLGRGPTFEGVFRRPIEKYGKTEALDLLRQRIRPFLLRRTKPEVDIDLPDKTEIIEHIELGAAQRDLYESLRLSLDADVREALRDRGVQGSSLVVLDALLKLRQCCCDPRLIKTPQAQEVKRSAKLTRLMSMLEELADSGRFALVFSQFTSMLRLIADACTEADIDYLELTGRTRNRDEVVRAFQRGEAPVFLVSLKAGGVGLNLTRADTVIHYDPWWNPAAEDQATDRAHRIGQDQHVFVYKLVARGTLEERIAELQRGKRALTDATLEHGGASHLVADDLAALYYQLM